MYGNPYYSQMQRFQSNGNQMMQQPYMQPIQQAIQPLQSINNQMGLLGKIVDSVDVVKAMDIPLDGSVSYFPLIDGSSIVTKKLQTDGTSKTVIYKPVDEENNESVQYATIDDLEQMLNDFEDIKDLKDELKSMKKEIKEIKSEIKNKED